MFLAVMGCGYVAVLEGDKQRCKVLMMTTPLTLDSGGWSGRGVCFQKKKSFRGPIAAGFIATLIRIFIVACIGCVGFENAWVWIAAIL